ncbi:sensor domain-containing diguanylate cyclase [Paenibacillus sp. MER 99-2]|uniref:sensor domain-containing diguanylate cyclase n=1 Tax=Paenibacillus sp. MER 99-2 TaxID=2939572 RepID=UPI00203CA95B|nr:sensor domain-containing diguanylate cyclase [Paenibacillus sp. MER 99-2]MCM3171836.1 sensor domain-containing diguanylate cyclase [Paenibacillus sp. MER 99-2]
MDNLVIQALGKINMGILIIDRQLKVILWNGWLERFTGKSKEEVIGQNLLEVCPRFKLNMYQNILQNALYQGQSRFCSSALHKAFLLPKENEDEHFFKQNMHVEPLYENGRSYAMIQISDMTNTSTRVYKLKNLIKELDVEYNKVKISEKISKHLSMHDSLTGLPNRRAFNERLIWAINHAEPSEGRFAVLFVDTDGFKQINDTYGHEVGDQVLVETAKRLKENIRSTDSVARLSGDEFSIILNQLNDDHDAEVVCEKLGAAFSVPIEVPGYSINLSLSIGISIYPRHADEPAELLRYADQAMYRIKKNGKSGYAMYDSERD